MQLGSTKVCLFYSVHQGFSYKCKIKHISNYPLVLITWITWMSYSCLNKHSTEFNDNLSIVLLNSVDSFLEIAFRELIKFDVTFWILSYYRMPLITLPESMLIWTSVSLMMPPCLISVVLPTQTQAIARQPPSLGFCPRECRMRLSNRFLFAEGLRWTSKTGSMNGNLVGCEKISAYFGHLKDCVTSGPGLSSNLYATFLTDVQLTGGMFCHRLTNRIPH